MFTYHGLEMHLIHKHMTGCSLNSHCSSAAPGRWAAMGFFSDRHTDRQTDRQASILLRSISCVRRERAQTSDITSCWGQSHRNRPGASRSAVIAITTPTTAKNTHIRTQTHFDDTIVSPKLSISWVYWHNFWSIVHFCLSVWMCFSWSHFLDPFLSTSYLVSFIVVWFHIEFGQTLSSCSIHSFLVSEVLKTVKYLLKHGG